MLKERRRAAETVAADFLAAEDAADKAALLIATCLATMIEQRRQARLPVAIGLDALQLVGDAASDLVRARHRLIDAHKALLAVRDDIGLRAQFAYGDQSECPEVERFLVSGETPRLAAVA